MKKTEITTLWDKMLDRFPDWLDTKPPDDFGRTEVAWCNALAEFEECSADWVWNRMLERFRQHAEESPKFSFKPPSLDSICNHIRKALADHRRTLRQDTDAKLLADERENRGDRKLSDAAKECFAAVEVMTAHVTKHKDEAPTPPDTSDRANWVGVARQIDDSLSQPRVDKTPLKAEDFKKTMTTAEEIEKR